MRKIILLVLCVILVGSLTVSAYAVSGSVSGPSSATPGASISFSINFTSSDPTTSIVVIPVYCNTCFSFTSGTAGSSNASMYAFANGTFTAFDATSKVIEGSGTMTLTVKADACKDHTCTGVAIEVHSNGNTVTIPAAPVKIDHTWSDWGTENAATCLAGGTETRTCTACAKVERRNTNALGHDYQVATVPSTCTVAGTETTTCSRCNYNQVVTLPLINHDYEWRHNTESTCTVPGSETQYCRNCNSTGATRNLPLKDHTYNSTWTDCGDGRNHKHSCTVCGGAEITEAHSFKLVNTVEPDCRNNGHEDYECEKCDAVKQVVLPSTGAHSFANWVNNGDGTHTGTCTGCSVETKTENHSYGEWTVVTPSTCIAKGTAKRTCKCGAYETKELPLADHTYGSTWTDAGDGANHKHSCTVCGRAEVTEAHEWDSGVVTTPATCAAAGVKTFACRVCNAAKTEVIPATGEHDYTHSYRYNETEHVGLCTCGAENPVAVEHAYTINGEVLQKPTTTKEGKQEMFCVCGAKTVVTLNKISADYDESPKTGDITGQIVLYTTAAAALVVAAAYVFKRRIVK